LSDQYIWLNASYNFTKNAIIGDVVTDDAAKSTYRSVNLSGKMPASYYFYGSFGQKIKPLDMNMGINLNFSGNSSYNYINNALNNTQNYTYSAGIDFNKQKEKKYSFYGNFGPSYKITTASVQKSVNSNGWGWSGSLEGTLQLPGKLELTSDAQYQYNGKTQAFNESFERLIWNAALNKKFFKGENLKLSLSGRDLLNQNVGFDRSAYDGNITQNSYTTIQRYFLFSVIWDFSKMGGGVKK
jgi:hypothetical protein